MIEVIDSVWYGIKIQTFTRFKQIGIVAVKTLPDNKIKFYIGLAHGENLEKDEMMIAKNGIPFNPFFLFEWANGIMKNVEREEGAGSKHEE